MTGDAVPKLSAMDGLALLSDVVLPTLAQGVLIRRPRAVALAERLDLDRRAVRRLQRLRRTHGSGPLLLAVPGRPLAVILAPNDLRQALRDTPEPFSASTLEKRAALAHFEPRVSLASRPPDRAERRRLNDDVLQSERPRHALMNAFSSVVAEEVAALLKGVGGELDWSAFTRSWHRVARRVTLGDGARDDEALTDELARLRSAGNWAFLHPGRPRLFRRYRARLDEHLARAEPGSLAGLSAARDSAPSAALGDQATHWLFAFDAAGIATWRALALLASHPEVMERARAEIGVEPDLPFGRAVMLESVRLWPTTPAILRETTRDVPMNGGVVPAGTHVLIYVPFFGRDDESLPEAHRFAPELWLKPGRAGEWPLIPFSAGPGTCPAHHLVPALGARFLAELVRARHLRPTEPDRLRSDRDLPGTLDPFTLRFALAS